MAYSSQRERGATIGTVLLVTVVVVMLALALTGSSVTPLQLSQKATNGTIAQSMAESAIAAGLEEVLENEEFGLLGSEQELVELSGTDSKSSGKLSFNPEIAAEWGLPHSTNNLQSEGARSGADGRVVPGRSIHLVGQGESNGVTRTVEAIFYIPKFPYVVASSGRFETQGETLIASVDRVDDLKNLSIDDLLPGDALSNSTDPSALQLGKKTTITGDAKAAGGVELEPGAQILGQVLANSSKENIPTYKVTDFDPEANGKLGISHLSSGTVNKANYEGWVKRDGDLFVGQGLHLDNGVLYVNGDLTVSGGVTGVGALLVTGNTTITGRSALSTDNLAAIVSEGSVLLQGPTQQSSTFRGLVYSNKGLVAENMTLVGTLLVGGDQSDLVLKDTQVVFSPDSVKVDLQHSERTALSFVSPKGANPGAFTGTKGSDKTSDSKTRIYVSTESDGTFLIYPEGTDEKNALKANSVADAITIIKGLLALVDDPKQLQAFEATTANKLPQLLNDLQNGTVAHEEEAVDLVSFDPAQFLSLADRIRLLLIRDV